MSKNPANLMSHLEYKTLVCTNGINSILKKNPDGNFIHESIVEQLESTNFEDVGKLTGKEDYFAKISENSCNLIVIGNKNRRFDITLAESRDFPLLYKIFEIKEVSL